MSSNFAYDKTQDSIRSSGFGSDSKTCAYCRGSDHGLSCCKKFKECSFKEKKNFLRTSSRCFGCLGEGHISRFCTKRFVCKKCQKLHPTILHIERLNQQSTSLIPQQTSAIPKVNAFSEYDDGKFNYKMAVIPMKVRSYGCTGLVETYAFMDTGSNVSFCSTSLMQKLGITGKKKRIKFDTMGESVTMETFCLKGIQIGDFNEKAFIDLPTTYTKSTIPVSRLHIPLPEDLQKWPHLTGIDLPVIDSDIELLIGGNVAEAYYPLECLAGPHGSPRVTRTILGWIPWGVRQDDSQQVDVSYVTDARIISDYKELQNLDRMVRQAMNFDFPERALDEKAENSQNDMAFLKKVNPSIQLKEGHYVIELPFRDDDIKLPANKDLALKRLKSLEQKLGGQPQFKADYDNFMATILKRGYAELVPENWSRDDGRVWYIPHHGVYHARKKKIRVVFDCTARFNGVSLNEVLLPGPDLTSNLLGVLLRFRMENVAIMGDVEKMFYQVQVPEKDRDCLRFYWWPDGNLDSKPQIFRMTVHLCSNIALRQTALDFADECESDVLDAVTRCFYVDDCLRSEESVSDGIRLIRGIASICAKGGFRVTGWCSNDPEVVEAVPTSERAETDQARQRALGVTWILDSDIFGFTVSIKDKSPS
ncbi:uncharacterized protein LOC141902149 [Tubulanus polymorphus]|uniref:uncharacterized protein LOC141902149 n=1 Tax=Tubulanus polymorphus TaxID=672921 RepID=UPI003DA1DFB9